MTLLKIRREQLAALTETSVDAFVPQAVAMARTHWPRRCAELGPEGLEARVAAAIATARRYGVTTRRDALRFVNLDLALGARFHEDPRYPWAAAILQRPGVHPSMRVDLLVDQARDVLEDAEAT
jgi:hypothetical protein